MRQSTLGHEIENVLRPVLHCDVLELRAGHRYQLDHRAMQGRGIKFRRGAAFHVGQLGTFVANDERSLELAKVLCVYAEVGLQRMFHFHARRHIDE